MLISASTRITNTKTVSVRRLWSMVSGVMEVGHARIFVIIVWTSSLQEFVVAALLRCVALFVVWFVRSLLRWVRSLARWLVDWLVGWLVGWLVQSMV